MCITLNKSVTAAEVEEVLALSARAVEKRKGQVSRAWVLSAIEEAAAQTSLSYGQEATKRTYGCAAVDEESQAARLSAFEWATVLRDSKRHLATVMARLAGGHVS